jgi:heptosyltransferase-3
MTLGVREVLRSFYWRLRSNRRDAAHMLKMVAGFAASAVRLPLRLRRAGGRRPLLAIVLVERMGDIVAAEPIVRLARQRYPDAWICWIVQAPYRVLPDSYPEVDDVVTVRCLTEWMLLRRLNLFDVVWTLHTNGTDCPHCCMPLIDPRVPATRDDYYDHGSLLTVQCLCAGLPKLDESPVLSPPPDAVAAVDALGLPARFIVLHGVSSDPLREWSPEKWRELVARLLDADPAIHVVEVGLQPRVVLREDERRHDLCGRLTVLQTAELIRRARLYIGIDSGPAHLANAMRTPGVILLGRFFNFPRYMPFSGDYANGVRATVLQNAGPAADLTVDEVFAAVMERLGVPA